MYSGSQFTFNCWGVDIRSSILQFPQNLWQTRQQENNICLKSCSWSVSYSNNMSTFPKHFQRFPLQHPFTCIIVGMTVSRRRLKFSLCHSKPHTHSKSTRRGGDTKHKIFQGHFPFSETRFLLRRELGKLACVCRQNTQYAVRITHP